MEGRMADDAPNAVAAAGMAEESAVEAADRLEALLRPYKEGREADWRELLRGPLEAAIAGLSEEHGPRALAAEEARWIEAMAARFARLFPATWEEVRLCHAAQGLRVMIEMLGGAEVTVEAWREAGQEPPRGEVVRPYRRATQDLRWVV
jgi:hypothetical protein